MLQATYNGASYVMRLEFDPGDLRYERLYAAIINSPEFPRDRNEAKAVGKLLDKLECIGAVKPAQDREGNRRPHVRDELRLYETVLGGTVTLETRDHELCVKHVMACIPRTPNVLQRGLEDVLVMLEAVAATAQPSAAK